VHSLDDQPQSPTQLFGNRFLVRERKPVPNEDFEYGLLAHSPGDPQTYQEACQRSDKLLWEEAMKEEVNALHRNQTWELVDRPKSVNVVRSMWVYKLKKGVSGETRHKARLVAKGFSQIPGRDYNQTFAPVIKPASLRILFALAAKLNFDVDHVDITTAFLNGFLEEVIYIEQPEGFIQPGNENKVYKLNKALYGLKQAARS